MQTQDSKLEETNGQVPSGNPFDRTMPLAISISMLGIKKKVKTGKVQDEIPEDYSDREKTVEASTDGIVEVNKTLLSCPEYEAIKSLAGLLRTYLIGKKIPGGTKLFRSGTYPIPIGKLGEVDEKLQEFTQQFKLLVKKFCEVYELRKQESLERLRKQKVMGKECDLADEKDYPSIERVRRSFSIEYEYVSFGPPSSLKGFSKEMYQRELDKVKANCQQATMEVQLALRQMLADLLDHMVERLTDGPDGKKKRLFGSLMGNMKSFLADFKDKNITDDAELEAIAKKCEGVLAGKDIEVLKKDPDMRSVVVERLSKIKKVVDGLVTEASSRRMVVDD